MTRVWAARAIAVSAIGAWIAIIGLVRDRSVYGPLGLLACVLVLVAIGLWSDRLGSWLRCTPPVIVGGIAIGALTVIATHLGYAWMASLFPGLRGEVLALYSTAEQGPGPRDALPVVVLIIIAEELVFRGLLVEPGVIPATHTGTSLAKPWAAGAGATAMYALAQLGSGSIVLVLVAAALGAVWTVQRLVQRSILGSLLAHTIWTLSVLVFVPLREDY